MNFVEGQGPRIEEKTQMMICVVAPCTEKGVNLRLKDANNAALQQRKSCSRGVLCLKAPGEGGLNKDSGNAFQTTQKLRNNEFVDSGYYQSISLGSPPHFLRQVAHLVAIRLWLRHFVNTV
jgi:hypothetical protein